MKKFTKIYFPKFINSCIIMKVLRVFMTLNNNARGLARLNIFSREVRHAGCLQKTDYA